MKKFLKIITAHKYHFIRFFIFYNILLGLFLYYYKIKIIDLLIGLLSLSFIAAFLYYGIIEAMLDNKKNEITDIIDNSNIDEYKKKLIKFILYTSIDYDNVPTDYKKREHFISVYNTDSANKTFDSIIKYVKLVQKDYQNNGE